MADDCKTLSLQLSATQAAEAARQAPVKTPVDNEPNVRGVKREIRRGSGDTLLHCSRSCRRMPLAKTLALFCLITSPVSVVMHWCLIAYLCLAGLTISEQH